MFVTTIRLPRSTSQVWHFAAKYTAMQSQKAVSAHFTSKPFGLLYLSMRTSLSIGYIHVSSSFQLAYSVYVSSIPSEQY